MLFRSIMPVFGDQLSEEMHKQANVLAGSRWSLRDLKPELVRACLNNEEGYAEKRFALAFAAVWMSNNYEESHHWDGRTHHAYCRFVETPTSYNRFRSYLQRQGGMMTTKEVDFE